MFSFDLSNPRLGCNVLVARVFTQPFLVHFVLIKNVVVFWFIDS